MRQPRKRCGSSACSTDAPAREQIFYRRRSKNSGRKAGNIEDFIRNSGGAYEFALVLDADSLMEAEAILEMIARIEAKPELGLLQTLPLIVHARSIFGRALQFSAALYTPVYARGTALLQGREGPYWGHNAIFRVGAFAAELRPAATARQAALRRCRAEPRLCRGGAAGARRL